MKLGDFVSRQRLDRHIQLGFEASQFGAKLDLPAIRIERAQWTRLCAAISAKPDFVVLHALFFLLWLNRNDPDHSYVVENASPHTLIK